MSHFPFGGSYDTNLAWSDFNYVLQGAITDSAAAATALYAGVKTENGRISVTVGGADRLYTIGEKARFLIKGVGAVSTVPVSHATPGAWTSHNDSRGNGYAIADEGFFVGSKHNWSTYGLTLWWWTWANNSICGCYHRG